MSRGGSQKRERLVVLLGPTAVGKTMLSLSLAERMGSEIISGDSMLVYCGFDVGTAKPSREELARVPHHLVDILQPWEGFSVTRFVALAKEAIHAINARGKIPILAGGTGLYIKALLEGYQFNAAGGDDAFRRSLEELGRTHGKAYVHAMLKRVDPKAAARLHVNDFQRVVRAIEVAQAGEHISTTNEAQEGALSYEAYVVGLRRDRQELYARINARVVRMFDAGLEEEVRMLLRHGVTREMPAMKGIGYKEIAAYLAGECLRAEAIKSIQKSTRRFAKRQLTWYRRMGYIHWYEADMEDAALLTCIHADVKRYFEKMESQDKAGEA